MREVFVAVVYTPDDNQWYGPMRNSYEEAKADLPGLLEKASGWYLRGLPPWPWSKKRAKEVYGEIQKRFYMD